MYIFVSELEKFSRRSVFSMSDEKRPRNPYKAMALMTGISAQLVGTILIGLFLGKWLDAELGTLPLFLILGLLLGLASGIYSMLQLIKRFNGSDDGK